MTPAQEAYNITSRSTRPERRGVSNQRVISAAKEAVTTLALAERLCSGQMRELGGEWTALCPLPDHQERNPSFSVNPEKNVFWCHGCLRGGDVVELARYAWSYERHEVAMAAAELLHRFGHKIPPRPASWFRKQARQQPARDTIQETKIQHLRRRVFRIFLPMIEEIEDEGERRAEIELLWDAAQEIAICLWAGRRAA
jgi:DNA primase